MCPTRSDGHETSIRAHSTLFFKLLLEHKKEHAVTVSRKSISALIGVNTIWIKKALGLNAGAWG